MALSPFKSTLVDYAKKVRETLAANPSLAGDGSGTELALHPRFQGLLEALLPIVFASGSPHTLPIIIPEYTKKTIGRPDLAFVPTGSLARAFVELKPPENSLSPSKLTRLLM